MTKKPLYVFRIYHLFETAKEYFDGAIVFDEMKKLEGQPYYIQASQWYEDDLVIVEIFNGDLLIVDDNTLICRDGEWKASKLYLDLKMKITSKSKK